ncbi:MAG: hypothetical protein DSY80_04980 [Desulfocapsa sp.]|nr:MAG: hypothetical protein DSY80_04980 [Desulfocapsa sp.]
MTTLYNTHVEQDLIDYFRDNGPAYWAAYNRDKYRAYEEISAYSGDEIEDELAIVYDSTLSDDERSMASYVALSWFLLFNPTPENIEEILDVDKLSAIMSLNPQSVFMFYMYIMPTMNEQIYTYLNGNELQKSYWINMVAIKYTDTTYGAFNA